MTFDLVEHIHRHGFKRLLLAVSGGLDSICLAHYFIENREVLGIEWLGIAHVHHGLREGTADRDAKFVEEFAKSHNVPFFLKRLDGEALKNAEGSLEENARDARYKALVEIALDPSTSLHSAQDDTFLVSQPPYLIPHTSKQPKVATPYPKGSEATDPIPQTPIDAHANQTRNNARRVTRDSSPSTILRQAQHTSSGTLPVGEPVKSHSG